jgi:hypothetical protein
MSATACLSGEYVTCRDCGAAAAENLILRTTCYNLTPAGCTVHCCAVPVQVWYSSAWSHNTQEVFRQAITTLLTAAAAISKAPPQQRHTLHPSADALVDSDVLGLLRDWQVKQVPMRSARKAWQRSSELSSTWLCNFARKEDRLALAELELTGEITALGAGDVGSVVMFAVPQDKFGERAFDECILQVRAHHSNHCLLKTVRSSTLLRRMVATLTSV